MSEHTSEDVSGNKCPSCGTQVAVDASFCQKCGVPIESAAPTDSTDQGAEVPASTTVSEESENGSRKKGTLLLLLALAAIIGVVTLAYAALGGSSGPTAKQKAALITARTSMTEAQRCVSKTKAMLNALDQINSRLGVGLNFSDYSGRVGDAQVAYNASAFTKLSGTGYDCLEKVSVPAESALNEYIAAYNKWNDCVSNVDCSTDSIDGELQKHWTKATSFVLKSKSGLEGISSGAATRFERAQAAIKAAG